MSRNLKLVKMYEIPNLHPVLTNFLKSYTDCTLNGADLAPVGAFLCHSSQQIT